MATFLLFVYGTLKRGGVRHRALEGQPFLGEARTLPRHALLDLGAYPGLVPGEDSVHGELYDVDALRRPLLDELEGAPRLFALAPVELDDGRAAWAYHYRGGGPGPRLASGRWENPA
ncbi:MAG: gamma-glutamylcyclotransferase [Gemmataceae bacterium]|nr:gamma-glutamylcyclotransferase [Gemmataceae bacterium]